MQKKSNILSKEYSKIIYHTSVKQPRSFSDIVMVLAIKVIELSHWIIKEQNYIFGDIILLKLN
jgi:hypothetical protein